MPGPLKLTGSFLLGLSLICCSRYIPPENIAPEPATATTEKSLVVAKEFMAVTANPLATNAAYNILKKGGSAIDAAITAQTMLGLVEPQSSGIGGGAFVLYWDAAQQKLYSFDGRETAPLAATSKHFLRDDNKTLGFFDAVVGGHAVGTPGVIALLETLHQRFGKLPWDSLFNAAIETANTGFSISPRLATLLEKAPYVDSHPSMRAYFFENGKPKAAGQRLVNSAYATTLQRIANDGASEFYQGQTAAHIVDAIHQDPIRTGLLSRSDLASYKPKQRKNLCRSFKDYKVCGMPPPSSGGSTVIAILKMLEYQQTNRDLIETDFIHLFAEATRLAFADRNTYIADPDFVDVPLTNMLDTDYLNQRSASIPARTPLQKVAPGLTSTSDKLQANSLELPSTTHLSIVDAAGNIVSMTSSIETAFGSKILVDGFLLNNQLTDFSFLPRDTNGEKIANRLQGGKRPRSSMAPIIIFKDNQPIMALGSPGGSRIIPYVARTLYAVLNNGVSLQKAIEAPHIIKTGKKLELELNHFDSNIVGTLERYGHKISQKPQSSGLHGIRLKDGKLYSGVDPRREGYAMGD